MFVPRPETEVVAGFAIDKARQLTSAQHPVVVDLCAGSAAIALSVADEVPQARVHAVEISEQAIAWAVRNVAAAKPLTRARVSVHEADATSASTLPELDGSVDVVVSNPPYIPPDAVIRDPEVAEHDPARGTVGRRPRRPGGHARGDPYCRAPAPARWLAGRRTRGPSGRSRSGAVALGRRDGTRFPTIGTSPAATDSRLRAKPGRADSRTRENR